MGCDRASVEIQRKKRPATLSARTTYTSSNMRCPGSRAVSVIIPRTSKLMGMASRSRAVSAATHRAFVCAVMTNFSVQGLACIPELGDPPRNTRQCFLLGKYLREPLPSESSGPCQFAVGQLVDSPFKLSLRDPLGPRCRFARGFPLRPPFVEPFPLLLLKPFLFLSLPLFLLWGHNGERIGIAFQQQVQQLLAMAFFVFADTAEPLGNLWILRIESVELLQQCGAVLFFFLHVHPQTLPTVLAIFRSDRELGDFSAKCPDRIVEPGDVGLFLFRYAQEALPEVGIRHPASVPVKLDDVLGFIDVLVAQDLDESLTVVRLEGVEKPLPAGKEEIFERHSTPPSRPSLQAVHLNQPGPYSTGCSVGRNNVVSPAVKQVGQSLDGAWSLLIFRRGKRMRRAFQPCSGILLAAVLMTAVLSWLPPGSLAFDLFGSGKSEESPRPAGQSAQLPSLAGVAKSAMPAVVNISTTQQVQRRRMYPFPMPGPGPFGPEDPFEEFFRRFFGDQPPPSQQRSLGSGFIVSEDGYIITNNHVIGNADKITVRLSNHEEYVAKVIGSDDKTDIALIKINVKHALPTVPLGKSADLRVGDWVIAIGNPFGLEQTVTAGIVSAKGRVIGGGPYEDFIQTDASINPGNSGGPLLNLKGEVVGINAAIFSQTGGNIGIGFAIPIDLAKSIVTQLKAKGKVTRGWLGVAIQPVTPELAKSFGLEEPRGALVADVTKGSPADKAGVERGDVILSFNDTPIKDSHELPAVVAQTPVGERVTVTVLRRGREKSFTVTLGELTDQRAEAESGEESSKDWGITVASLTPETRRRFQLDRAQRGVVVVEVAPGSPAEEAGVQPGDVIEEVNRQPVNSAQDFTTATADAKNQDALLLLVRRGTATSFFALQRAG